MISDHFHLLQSRPRSSILLQGTDLEVVVEKGLLQVQGLRG